MHERLGKIALGEVTVPSGVLVLAMGSWVDDWPQLGRPLSARAAEAAAGGGGHLREWLCEAVAVPAVGRSLAVTAKAQPSVWDQVATIAVLEVDLGLPWHDFAAADAPRRLGDLPVDRCGMVLGDATALDSWVGFLNGKRSINGLADLSYHGKGAELVRAQFGSDRLRRPRDWAGYGWRDLPIDLAYQRQQEINAWAETVPERFVHASVDLHTHYYLAHRAGWEHPLHTGTVEVAGCAVLLIAWDQIEHSARHRGERAYGQVYPVTVERGDADAAVLRWTIPPPEPSQPETAD